MKSLPPNLKPSGKTAVFNQDTIPNGLLKDHRTLPGYWAKIVVIKGELNYVIQSTPEEAIKLDSSTHGVIEPQTYHRVEPIGEVSFYVEFYKE